MPPLAIALVLVAAVLHAGWNVLLKTSGDPLRTAVRLQATGTAILFPLAAVAWLAGGQPPIPPEVLGLVVLSGILEAIYFVCLSAAYARGDLSLVYPLARGSAPLIAVAIGIGLLAERLALPALVGVGCLLVGILLVARPWRALRLAGREHRGAIGFALATGVSIAAYSAVDRVAVRLVEPWLYGALLAVAATVFTATIVTVGRRIGLISTPAGADASANANGAADANGAAAEARRGGASGAGLSLRDGIAGVLSLTAYLLILFAYSFAPLAAVAPLRESGIVLAAAWGAIRLGEATGRRQAAGRIAAAALVVLGAVLLAVSR
ncbi:MAG TPA: EamA family transporter [Candidatus Eisenbacteria bacterium]|nr:EamA family transporter [Candidatus Eisenbacteria bacterium]